MLLIICSILNITFLFYTDPGAGALLLQLIMATLLGGLFYFRKLKDFLFKKSPPENNEKVSSEVSIKGTQE